MNSELHYQISMLLFQEANLLDHRQYREWLNLLTDDIKYKMPIRITMDNNEQSNGLVSNMSYIEENKEGLTLRVERLYTKSAWVENPAPRQRHNISNIVITDRPSTHEYYVRSNFVFKRSRNEDPNTEELFGERIDLIRKVNDVWKIAERTIYPDQAVLTVMNLSMFL